MALAAFENISSIERLWDKRSKHKTNKKRDAIARVHLALMLGRDAVKRE
jgi:hypothetical protein